MTIEIKDVDPDITIKTVVTCSSCWEEVVIDSTDADEAQEELQNRGWRSVETDTELHGCVCPNCVAEYKQEMRAD